MTDPEFDKDGYPTDETLKRIETWPIVTLEDAYRAMDFAGRAWSYPDRWKCQPRWRSQSRFDLKRLVRRYVFSTGGWSGNESVVGAIEANTMLQMLGAWSWRRGGHYEYRFTIDVGTA